MAIVWKVRYNSDHNARDSKSLIGLEDTSSVNSRFFMLCGSCFWCASSLIKKHYENRCPQCLGLINYIPISTNEIS
jgi:hypothetical protein